MMATNRNSVTDRNRFKKDGFVYAFERRSRNNTTNYWRCISSPNCRVRLQIRDKVIVKSIHAHNHPAQTKRKRPVIQRSLLDVMQNIPLDTVGLPSVNELRGLMDFSARSPSAVNRTSTPSTVVNQNGIQATVDRTLEEDIFNVESRSSLYGVLGSIPIPTPEPDNILEMEEVPQQTVMPSPFVIKAPNIHNMVIPNSYVAYYPENGEKENFLQADYGSGQNRILVFGRYRSIFNLKECMDWYIDGSLKISSKPVPYMFVIMAYKFGSAHPMFYVILKKKDKATFRRMIVIINTLVPNFRPRSIGCNFEQGLILAVEDYYSGIDIYGCFFHLINYLEKYLSTIDLLDEYKTNRDFEIRAKMILALAFVPVGELEECIDLLNIELTEEQVQIMYWFEDNFVGRPNRRTNGRHMPKFQDKIWSVYERLVAGEIVTNLKAESVHQIMQSELDPDAPTTEHLLNKLCKMQRGRDADYEHLRTEKLNRFHLEPFKEENPRIMDLLNMYGSMSKVDFLRSMALQFVPEKNYDDLKAAIQKTLDLKLIEYHESLEMDSYKLDEHCPQFIIFHPSIRTKLAQSTLVQKHKLIVQDKSFCVGPATFGKIISDLQLSGTVIQSHVNSPRTTAYLASLLSQNENIKKLLAFSAGNRKSEYENYFNDLGIKNILIFSEKLIDLPPDSTSLEEVIAVFATPPNSYSAVADPIDLVCSRGGDLSMLEVLTETEDTLEGKRRVATILEEQKNTLKFAMSRPQIQFVLYETHSEIEAENNQMVRRTVSEINKCAKIHHATIQGKLKYLEPSDSESEVKVIESKNFDDTEDSEGTTPVASEPEIVPKIKKKEQIIVPDCDLFDVSNLPQLCPNSGTCTKVNKEGCYLALMQRKQVTRLDNKYMIQMAETRGLFGSEMGKKSSKNMKKKVERMTPSPPLKIRRVKEIEIGRIAAPTLSSVGHSKFVNVGSSNECMKHKHQQKTPQTRRWWTETTRHITNVRHSLSKQKILPSVNNTEETTKGHATKFVNSLVRQTKKVDEIVAKSSKNSSSVPFYPKLRLTRNTNRYDNKIPVPIHVTLVTFPAKHFPIS